MKLPILVLITFILMGLTEWKSDSVDGFAVEMQLSAEKIEVLDTIQLTLTLFYPAGYHPDIDVLKKNLGENGAMIKYPLIIKKFQIFPEKADAPGHFSQTLLFTLEPQVAGTYDLTFLNIPFIPSEKSDKIPVEIISEILTFSAVFPKYDPDFQGEAASLLTFSTFLPIELNDENRIYILENPSKLKIQAQKNQKMIEEKAIPFLGLIGIFFAILLIWLFVKKDKSIEEKKPVTIKALSIQSQAIEELEKIKEQRLPEKGRFDELYIALTDLVRRYIERRYLIMAPKLTSEEFLKEVNMHPAFSQELRQALKKFIEISDRVKFAKYNPSLEECEKANEAALETVLTP